MGNVEWNEGMSVGVEAIDSDHKALLLVINEVNESLGSDDADILIKEIFEKLEKYIKQHFQREERLLEQCDYSELDDHKKQHCSRIANGLHRNAVDCPFGLSVRGRR